MIGKRFRRHLSVPAIYLIFILLPFFQFIPIPSIGCGICIPIEYCHGRGICSMVMLFNLWVILKGVNLSLPENLKIANISSKIIGEAIVILGAALILVKNISHNNLKVLFSTCLLISFMVFLFLTNMHERYLYPVFPTYCILLGLNSRLFNLKFYFFLSLIHLLNLYNLWFLPYYFYSQESLIFNNFIVPRLLSVLLSIFLS